MGGPREIVSVYVTLMMMTMIQYWFSERQQRLRRLRQRRRLKSTKQNRRQRAYQPPIPYNRLSRCTFVGMDDVLCYHLTRFSTQEINRFLPLLALHEIHFRNRLEATPEEALAVMLIRLSYPSRYWAMMDRFGHSRTWLCIVFNDTIIHLYRRYRKMLAWDNKRLTFERLSAYSQAIHNLGGGSCFWGFIDGSLDATCRPVLDQQGVRSGHTSIQKHGYKYQTVVTPDGLVSSLMGPFIGLHGNWKMVESSGLEKQLRKVNGNRPPAAHALYVYCLDPAFRSVYGITGPYRNYPGRLRTPAEDQFNTIMSNLRKDVEHGFATHQNLWTWNAYHLGLKISQ